MLIAVADGTSKKNLAVIKDGGFAFLEGVELFEEVGKLRNIPLYNLRILFDVIGLVAVVRDAVPSAEVKEVEATAGLGVTNHEGADARRVGLEREGQDVEHEADVFAVVVRNAGARAGEVETTGVKPAFLGLKGILEAFLDGTDGLHVFLEFHTVG